MQSTWAGINYFPALPSDRDWVAAAAQLDAQNDVLVLENLAFSGYRNYKEEHLADLDHCRVVLRRMAHFHAISTLMQRDSEMCLVDLFPFAVDAECFRQRFDAHVAGVKAELVAYLSGRRQG